MLILQLVMASTCEKCTHHYWEDPSEDSSFNWIMSLVFKPTSGEQSSVGRLLIIVAVCGVTADQQHRGGRCQNGRARTGRQN